MYNRRFVAASRNRRAFEEEVMLSGFGEAPVKTEGAGVSFDMTDSSGGSTYTFQDSTVSGERFVVLAGRPASSEPRPLSVLFSR